MIAIFSGKKYKVYMRSKVGGFDGTRLLFKGYSQ